MSRTIIIQPSESLVDAVLGLLSPEGNDYTSSAVVFQGKRPAHFLRKALAARHGAACIPPRIFSFEALTDYLYHRLPGPSGPEVGLLDAAGLLYDLHTGMTDRIGGEKFDRLDAFLPLGLRLYEALEELRMHEVPLRDLRSVLPLSQFPNAEKMAGFYEAFYQLLEDAGLQTRAMRLEAVTGRCSTADLAEFRRILVAGFYFFTPLERKVVRLLGSCPQTTFIYQLGPGLADRLREVGDESPLPAPAGSRPVLAYYKAGGTHGEVFALNHLLERFLTRGDALDERTVVALPAADALFPIAEWTLPLVPERNYNVSLGYPVGRTPAFGFLASLLQVVVSMDRGRVYAPDYIACMLHPYTKNILFNGRPEPTRILLHTLEEHLAEQAGAAFVALEDLESDELLHTRAAGRVPGIADRMTPAASAAHLRLLHTTLIRRLAEAPSLGDFSRGLMQVLTFIDEQSAVRQHEFFRPFVLALLDQLDALAMSRLASYAASDPAAYCTIALRWLREASVPFPGTPVQGLQVLGLLETRNLQFDRVCIMDVNEDVLPGAPRVDPLLPPPVRLALGLPLPEERERIVEYHAAVLLRGAKEVHLLYQEGGKKERSRLIEQLFWEEEQRQRKLLGEEAVMPVQFNLTLANRRPDPIPKSAAMAAALEGRSLTASALDTYLRCPLKFYYAHLLGLRERRQVEADMDPAGIGDLVHEVLREMDAERCGRRLDAAEDRTGDLEHAVDRVFLRRFGSEASASQILLRGQIEHQLGRYLSWYREEVLTGKEVTMVALEVDLAGEYAGRLLAGRADRIERREGRTTIIDYKTGGDAKRYRFNIRRLNPDDEATWSSCLRSFQLPLYMLMAGASATAPFEQADPVYVILGDPRRPMSPEIRMFDPDIPLPEQWEKVTRTLSALLTQMYDPAHPFAPPGDLSACCPLCSYSGICGTGWVRGVR